MCSLALLKAAAHCAENENTAKLASSAAHSGQMFTTGWSARSESVMAPCAMLAGLADRLAIIPLIAYHG